MPATRSRSSTEQPAEVASEEVKQVVEEPKEIVDAPVVAEEVAPANGSAVVESAVEEAPATAEVAAATAEVVQAEEATESVPATNGSSEVETNGKDSVEVGKDGEAESVPEVNEPEAVVLAEKRKSDVVDDEKPDSTEVAAKKAKVDDEVSEEVAPVVEASA